MLQILVVDDELAILQMLEEVLTDAGYAVLKARDGREALARLGEVRPDLIVCDLMMPRLDGRQLCRAIQADPVHRGVPVVLMSAGYQAVEASTEAPYAAFVRKPFQVAALLRAIEQVLRRPAD